MLCEYWTLDLDTDDIDEYEDDSEDDARDSVAAIITDMKARWGTYNQRSYCFGVGNQRYINNINIMQVLQKGITIYVVYIFQNIMR